MEFSRDSLLTASGPGGGVRGTAIAAVLMTAVNPIGVGARAIASVSLPNGTRLVFPAAAGRVVSRAAAAWCCCPDSNGGPTDYESCTEMNGIKGLGDSL